MRETIQERAGRLCHPAVLASIGLLVLNDHLLKPLLHSWLTGKLSDFAGLFFFPVLLSLLLPDATLCVLATGAVFASLKTLPAVNAAVSALAGPIALDPTDLIALLSLGPALWLLRRPARPRRFGLVAAMAAGAASLATSSAGEWQRNFPEWQIAGERTRAFPCGSVEAAFVKSGKTGAGLSLIAHGCGVSVREARFSLRSQAAEGVARGLYVPFFFDGDRAWNEGDRDAALRLSLLVDGAPVEWELRATDRISGDALYGFRLRVRPESPR